MSTAISAGRRYAAPPRTHNAKGAPRRVGIELELGHLSLDETLELVRASVGGVVHRVSPAEGYVDETPFGRFGVEVDMLALKERSYLRPLEDVGIDPNSKLVQALEESIVRVAREVVPIEIVTPPIAWDQLQQLDELWFALRRGGAQDTRASLLYAFGMHLNPEAPDLEASTIAQYVRAFLLLEPWLSESVDVDLSRRIAPFIRPFPAEYAHLALQPDYAPDWPTLIDDYLEHNPTRNRPLDMVPLFVHAGGRDLSTRVEEWALVKPRPTFHYRLPNSEVESENWTPAVDWNRWVQVEALAASPALLRDLAYHHGQMRAGAAAPEPRDWIDHLKTRLGLGIASTAVAAPVLG